MWPRSANQLCVVAGKSVTAAATVTPVVQALPLPSAVEPTQPSQLVFGCYFELRFGLHARMLRGLRKSCNQAQRGLFHRKNPQLCQRQNGADNGRLYRRAWKIATDRSGCL